MGYQSYEFRGDAAPFQSHLVCTHGLSDGQGQGGAASTERGPFATEPSRTGLGSAHRAVRQPLCAGALQALGDDLFAATLDGATADVIIGGAELVIALSAPVI